MSARAFETACRSTSLSRRLGALALIGALAAPAGAQDAAPPLGRLFFTPERRQELDRQRQFKVPDRPELNADPTLTINGVVTRSSGQRTVWINGVAHNENPGGVVVTTPRYDPAEVVVHAAGSPPANARVGDTVHRQTGEATGLLERGSIKPGRPPAGRPR